MPCDCLLTPGDLPDNQLCMPIFDDDIIGCTDRLVRFSAWEVPLRNTSHLSLNDDGAEFGPKSSADSLHGRDTCATCKKRM